jgi:hypothetical protein
LLDEDLGEGDHLLGVELLSEIDLVIGCILLIAGSCGSEKGAEGSNGDGIAFGASSCGETGLFPFSGGLRDGLLDAFFKDGRGGNS